jgi:hypothetical protein
VTQVFVCKGVPASARIFALHIPYIGRKFHIIYHAQYANDEGDDDDDDNNNNNNLLSSVSVYAFRYCQPINTC